MYLENDTSLFSSLDDVAIIALPWGHLDTDIKPQFNSVRQADLGMSNKRPTES